MNKNTFSLLGIAAGVVAILSLSASAAPPVNDFYAAPAPIAGPSGSTTGTVAEASPENGEPVHAGLGGDSVWFTWTAPGNGAAIFDTTGSSFDTVLAVYTGRSIVSATLVAENDDNPLIAGSTSRVTFPITSGTVYHIAVAGPDGSAGFNLNWTTLANGVVQFTKDSYVANEESGTATITLERIGGGAGPLAVPVIFPAPIENTATAGADYDATPITANFAAGAATTTITVPLVVDADLEGDETLSVALGSLGDGGAAGLRTTATLTIRDAQDDPPYDKLATAKVLTGPAGSEAVDNTLAGIEPSELPHSGVTDGRSLWFRFKAPSNGALKIDTLGSVIDGLSDELDTVVDIYTGPEDIGTVGGSTIAALASVAANDNDGAALTSRLVIPVLAGRTYFIAVDSRDDAGQIALNWAFSAAGFFQFSQPEFAVGDDVSSATVTVSRVGSTVGAASVGYATVDLSPISAAAGVQYVSTSGLLSFASGEAAKSFNIPLLNNTAATADSLFGLQLTAAGDGALLATAAVRIVNVPPNDNFAAAIPLAGAADSTSATNVGARAEPGEPVHAIGGGHSIWFKWRAPGSGAVSFDTADSSTEDGNPLDTVLAVYTGAAVNALTSVAGNDNPYGFVTARTAFPVTAGTTYYIAVDSRDGAVGDVELAWLFSPKGLIQFSQPTYQVNENAGVATITVTRTAAASLDAVSVDLSVSGITATDGDDFGATVDTVDFKAGETIKTFTIPIVADAINEADETIQLTLSSSDGSALVGEQNVAILTINDRADDPVNDNFSNAIVLAPAGGNTFAVTTGASREDGEPFHALLPGHRSVWYRWTASAAGLASFDTLGSIGFGGVPLDTALAVYTGSLGSLTQVAANDDAQAGVKTSRVIFSAKAGLTYFIAVDSAGDDGGEVNLTWKFGGGGLLQFRQSQYAVSEKAGKVTITVDRVGTATGPVSATWTAQEIGGGGATKGLDFAAQVSTGTVNFAPGATAATFDVAITDDTLAEGSETFAIALSNPTGGATLISDPILTTVLIDDDDDDPASDAFGNQVPALTAAAGSASLPIIGSGVEPGEPATPGGHTIWTRWTAPANGIVQFDTAGSGIPGAPLDTILTAYTGASLAALQLVKTNDDVAPGDVSSRISFAAVSGTTYQISIDARGVLSGPAKLNWQLTTGGAFGFDTTSYRVNENAGSVQINIIRTGANVNEASVTYETIDGTANAPANYGARTATLTFGAGQLSRSISIPIINSAVGEQTFTVHLKDPSFGSVIAQESAVVRIFDLNQKPGNDSFTGASVLPSDDGSFAATNVGASRDAGENLPSDLLRNLGGGRTVWFKWKSPLNGDVTFDTSGSTVAGTSDPLDTVMAAFIGSDPKKLTLVAENDEDPESSKTSAVTFHVVSGRAYTIVVDSVGEASGPISLNWSLQPPDLGPLMAPVAGFTPTVTFSESFTTSIVAGDTVGNNSNDVTFILPLNEVDITGLDASTEIGVSMGAFSHADVLGSDPAYKAGKTSASFPLFSSDTGAKVGSVDYSWTAAKLTVRVRSTKGTEFEIYSESFDPTIVNTVDASADFAGVHGDRLVYVTGTSRTVSSRGFDLLSVSIKGTADYTPPTATIVAPSSVAADVAQVNISGTAKDDFALSTSVPPVAVLLNGVDLSDTLTTTSSDDGKSATWSVPGVPLVSGANTIAVIATDDSGNVSTTTRTIIRPKQAPISIVMDGQGSFTSSFSGSLLAVGQTYTVTAVPAATSLFRGWKANDGSMSSLPAFTFTMAEGLRLTAKFIPNPFLNLRGTFNGFARSSTALPGDTGAFTVDVTGMGGFTGSFYLGTKRTIIAGTFDDAGNFVKVFPSRATNGPPLVVTLRLDLTGSSDQVTGTISDGTFFSGITADRQVFDPKTNPTPLVGKFTAVLSTAVDLRSSSNGYLTLTVTGDGSVRFAGTLADNTPVGGSAFLSKSGVMQMYDPLPANAGLAGALAFAPSATGTLQGVVTWYRPTSGSIDLKARGERFVTPVKARVFSTLLDGKTTAELGGAGLIPAVVQNIVVGNDNKVIVTPAVNLLNGISTITFDLTAGTFSASVKRLGKAYTAKGVVLQKSAVAGGFYISAGPATGYVLIGTP